MKKLAPPKRRRAKSLAVAPLSPVARWGGQLPACIHQLAFSPDGSRLAAVGLAGPVGLLDIALGAMTELVHDPVEGALSACWSPDGAWLATGGHDGRVCLFSRDGEPGPVATVGRGWVEHLSFSADGKTLAVGLGKGLHLLSARLEPLAPPLMHPGAISSLLWLPGRAMVTTACYGGLRFVDVGRGVVAEEIERKGASHALVASQDGEFLVAGGGDEVHVWGLNSRDAFRMGGFPTKVNVLAFSPDSSWLAMCAGEDVALWDFSGGSPARRKARVLEAHQDLVSDFAWLPLGSELLLVSVGLDGRFCLWTPGRTAKPVAVVELKVPWMRVATSAAGRWVAVGGRNGELSLVGF
jgi:WD40 repeat protein